MREKMFLGQLDRTSKANHAQSWALLLRVAAFSLMLHHISHHEELVTEIAKAVIIESYRLILYAWRQELMILAPPAASLITYLDSCTDSLAC